MKFSTIIGQSLTEPLLNGVKTFRTVIFTAGNERLTLPVTPSKYSVTVTQNNKIVDILDFGEALIFGNTGLRHLKVKCFFPATYHQYPFVVGDGREPEECLELLNNWRTGKTAVRVIVTDSPVNLMMGIQRMEYSEKDGSRDIYYSLDLAEYRDLNVPNSNYQKQVDRQTGLKERPNNEHADLQSKLVSNALDILEKSKQTYGNFSSLAKFIRF